MGGEVTVTDERAGGCRQGRRPQNDIIQLFQTCWSWRRGMLTRKCAKAGLCGETIAVDPLWRARLARDESASRHGFTRLSDLLVQFDSGLSIVL